LTGPGKSFLHTVDKIAIAYEHDQRGLGRLVIICPGFFNSMNNRWMRLTRQFLAQEFDTLVFDFRGHGKSSGRFTWSAREHLDLEAVLRYARDFNYPSIGILGFSLGAAVSINTLSHKGGVASMVLVSTPLGFWDINYHFWEPEMFSDLKDNFSCAWEGKGVRPGNLFLRKPRPLTRIKHIKNIPILFIHGTKDWIIKDYHSQKLFDAYEAPEGAKKLALVEGGLHAERLIQQHRQEMENLILGWFAKTLGG
jgi:pimeloyl-ACP methyl ester carboxylesterase